MVKFQDLEIWDNIKGYENYKVSSKGRVFSIRSNKVLKPWLDDYYRIELSDEKKKRKTFYVHKLVANTFYFAEDYKGCDIDHIDRDKTNNNLLNLRFCSRSENQGNVGIQKNNTSGYKGVSWDKGKQKWGSMIRVNRKLNHLGFFDTKEEAYEAYKEASKKYHGEYGYAP